MREPVRPGPDDATREWATDLVGMLDALPAGENRTVRLVYFARRSQDEVAAQLGLTTGVVAHLVASGLQNLAGQLGVRRPAIGSG